MIVILHKRGTLGTHTHTHIHTHTHTHTHTHICAPLRVRIVHQTISYFIFIRIVHPMISFYIFIKIVHRTILGGSEDDQKAFAVLVLFAVTLGHEFSLTIHE